MHESMVHRRHTAALRVVVLQRFATVFHHCENRVMLSFLLRWQTAAIGTSWHGQHSENTEKERHMRHTHAVPCFVRAARRWQLSWQRYGWHMLLRNAEGSFERYGQLQNAATAIVRRWRQRQDLMLCRALARWRSNTSFSVSTHRQHQACHMMRSVALRWSHSSLLWGWRLLQHAGEVRQQLVFARSEALSCVVRRMEHREHKLIARFTMRWRMAVASFGIWHVAKRASVVQSTSQREQGG